MGVTTVFRIGRGEINDIVIDDPSISREHAELRRKGKREFTLVDLNSTNGTCVRAGSKWIEIESATVDNDERVLIGEVVTTVDGLLETCAVEPQPEEKHALFGLKLPSRLQRTDFDAPTNDQAGNRRGELERSAQRLTDRDVAQLIGPYRSAHLSAGPVEAAFETERSGAEPAFARGRPSANEVTEPRGPAFANRPAVYDGLEADPKVAPEIGPEVGPEVAPEIDSASIVVGRSGSFRASTPRPDWTPPRERRFRGRGISKWAAISLGSIFLVSAAAAGVVVYTTEPEDKASERGNDVTPAIFARVVTAKKPVTGRRAVAPPAIKPAAVPASLIGTEESRTISAMNKSGAKYWARTYGGEGQRRLMAITPARGGGAFAAGSVKDPVTGDHNAWLMRLDSYGNVIWQKKIGGAGDDHALALRATRKGGVVAAGSVDGGKSIWIGRFDKVGEQMWRRTVPTTKGGHATAVIRLGKSFVVSAIDRTGNGVRSLLIRLKGDGEIVWQRQIGGAYTWVSDIARAGRRGLLLVGVTRETAAAPRTLWVMRTDGKGLKVWQQTYARTEGVASSAFVRRARRKSFIIATTLEGKPGAASARVMRIKKDGTVLWDHVLPSQRSDRVAGLELQRGGVILAGSTGTDGKKGRDLWIARLNVDGTLDWQRRYGGKQHDGAAALAQGRRGVLFVAGATTAAKGQGWVLKLNRRGQLSPANKAAVGQ